MAHKVLERHAQLITDRAFRTIDSGTPYHCKQQQNTTSMGFKKGQSGNPKGRPKGKPNKATGTLREFIANLIDENRDQIRTDIAGLEPKERLQMLERMMQYVLPKMESTKTDIRIEHLSESELSNIAQDILTKIDNENPVD
ncbi:MAG: hypothetical protein IJ764_00040 [Bacteroidales bacterium]|nr:hypothetical protein [Bacteroidales bacterium]